MYWFWCYSSKPSVNRARLEEILLFLAPSNRYELLREDRVNTSATWANNTNNNMYMLHWIGAHCIGIAFGTLLAAMLCIPETGRWSLSIYQSNEVNTIIGLPCGFVLNYNVNSNWALFGKCQKMKIDKKIITALCCRNLCLCLLIIWLVNEKSKVANSWGVTQ